jgi:hypothetical protein
MAFLFRLTPQSGAVLARERGRVNANRDQPRGLHHVIRSCGRYRPVSLSPGRCPVERRSAPRTTTRTKLIRRGRLRLVPVRELERWLDANAAKTLEADR